MNQQLIYLAGGAISLYWLFKYRLPINLKLALCLVVGWAIAGAYAV
jgi:hypothetical protein